jgi:hypothetical protein
MNDAVEVGNTTIRLDLSNYALKNDTATKIDINELRTKLADKLDREGSHQHTIGDIKELDQTLNQKLDNNRTYSYKVLINDIETIPYLETLKTPLLEIVKEKSDAGYKISVDNTGDLLISLNDVVIASYNKIAGNWIINGINLNEFITETQETLKNHYEAINILMSKSM